jgi:hypothetical protein
MDTQVLLDQDVYWITADRLRIRLIEMDEHHRAATLAMLRRRAEYQRKIYYMVLGQKIYGDAPDEVMAELEADTDRALEMTAEAWLESRPLIIALARLVHEDEQRANTVDGEVLAEDQGELSPVRRELPRGTSH